MQLQPGRRADLHQAAARVPRGNNLAGRLSRRGRFTCEHDVCAVKKDAAAAAVRPHSADIDDHWAQVSVAQIPSRTPPPGSGQFDAPGTVDERMSTQRAAVDVPPFPKDSPSTHQYMPAIGSDGAVVLGRGNHLGRRQAVDRHWVRPSPWKSASPMTRAPKTTLPPDR